MKESWRVFQQPVRFLELKVYLNPVCSIYRTTLWLAESCTPGKPRNNRFNQALQVIHVPNAMTSRLSPSSLDFGQAWAPGNGTKSEERRLGVCVVASEPSSGAASARKQIGHSQVLLVFGSSCPLRIQALKQIPRHDLSGTAIGLPIRPRMVPGGSGLIGIYSSPMECMGMVDMGYSSADMVMRYC